MKKEIKSNVQSDLVTGLSSAVGTAIGVVAGNTLASEIYAAERSDDSFASTTQPVSADSEHASSASDAEPVLETLAEPPTKPDPASAASDEGPEIIAEATSEEISDAVPDVVVVDYGSVANDDGSQMDVAVVSIDGRENYLVDVDQDGTADVLMADINGDGRIDEAEMMNVEEEGIAMATFQTEILADQPMLASKNDYVNDANVDEYMA